MFTSVSVTRLHFRMTNSEPTQSVSELRARIAVLERELADARKADDRFRVLADTAPVMIWMSRPDRLCDFFNKPWLDFTGRSFEDEFGNGWADGVHPDDLDRCIEIHTTSFDARRPFRMEYRLRRHDGAYRWLLDNGAPRYQPDGAFAGYIGSCIDITDVKELESQLRQSQKMESIGRLAGGVAHDFNNVLTVVQGFGSFLLGAIKPGQAGRQDVEEILRAAGRGAKLTQQLLAFSRRQVLEPEHLELNEVLHDLMPMLEQLIGESYSLRVAPARYLGRTFVDRQQLEQAVVNLVVNARDAMPGGGTITLETENAELDAMHIATRADCATIGAYVMLAVSDTGQGMDAATQARALEPFFTTKAPGQGTGVGLAIVYGIVKQSGGCVWLYSEPGRGTTVKLFFPRVEAAVPVPAIPSVARSRCGGSETILLVEDDSGVAGLSERALRDEGYVVLRAASPEEALSLARARSGPVHLILTDVFLPGMTGDELAKRLLAILAADGGVPAGVLYVSGYTEHTVHRQGVLQPGTAFLPKPFTPDSLVGRVREVLDGRMHRSTGSPVPHPS
jgi:two-component system cell cycle sensor histidine kinase/response regulator CckA